MLSLQYNKYKLRKLLVVAKKMREDELKIKKKKKNININLAHYTQYLDYLTFKWKISDKQFSLIQTSDLTEPNGS